MQSTLTAVLVLAWTLASAAPGQTFSINHPGTFIDLSLTGGTQILGVGDDTSHTITTTVGNALFPAGPVLIGNNGVAIAGATTGAIAPTNTAILGTTTLPTGLPTGNGLLCVYWDDNVPLGGTSNTTIWFQEAPGVLAIMWLNEDHVTAPQGAVTFEIQVFSNPGVGPWIQFLYPDTTYASGNTNNAGASATIGYVKGTNAVGHNVQWTIGTPSVPDGTILSVFSPFALNASSPVGPGSFQLSLVFGPPSGIYFMPITLNAGGFPNGWCYGIDIGLSELINQLGSGFPFVGTLSPTGTFTIGPFFGLPTGLTLYAVAVAAPPSTPPSGRIPTVHSLPISYTIP